MNIEIFEDALCKTYEKYEMVKKHDRNISENVINEAYEVIHAKYMKNVNIRYIEGLFKKFMKELRK